MIAYISTGTSYHIYDRYFSQNKITSSQQAQKINYMFITGVARNESVKAISILPFDHSVGVRTKREIFIEEGTEFICIPNNPNKLLHGFSNIIHSYSELAKICKIDQPRAIVCDSIHISATIAALRASKKFHIPCIAIVTDLPEYLYKAKRSLQCRWLMHMLRKYDGYILITELMKDKLIIHNKQYSVVEGASEVELIYSRARDRKKRVCLFSGTLTKNIGLEELTEAFIQLSPANTELHFYGKGAFAEELKIVCKYHQNVKYFGQVLNSEVIKRQKEATLLINPRLSDLDYTPYSFPSKLLEYMGSGTPVLSTKLKGIPGEYYDHIFTIIDESVEGFVAALDQTLSLSNKELESKGRAAYEFVKKNKNKYSQGQKIIDLINRLQK